MSRFSLKTTFDGYCISTVLAMELDFGDPDFVKAAKTYETMIFKILPDGNIDFSGIYCKRSETEKEAIERHKEAIEWVANERT